MPWPFPEWKGRLPRVSVSGAGEAEHFCCGGGIGVPAAKHLAYLCLHFPFVKQGNYNLLALHCCWEASLMFVNHLEDESDCYGRCKISGLHPPSLVPGRFISEEGERVMLFPFPFPTHVEHPKGNILSHFPKCLCPRFPIFSSRLRKHYYF